MLLRETAPNVCTSRLKKNSGCFSVCHGAIPLLYLVAALLSVMQVIGQGDSPQIYH